MADTITFAHFQPHIGKTFTATLDNGTYSLILSEATALKPHDFPGKVRDPFQLKFTGPITNALDQRTYTLKNDIMGSIDIFLVPIGQDKNNLIYEAIYT